MPVYDNIPGGITRNKVGGWGWGCIYYPLESGCHVKRLASYLQGQGHSAGSNSQKITFFVSHELQKRTFFISPELLNLLHPNVLYL